MSSSESKTGTAQIGVTGLAVMGSNLARNFAHHGYTVALHNRSIAKTDALLKEHGDEGKFVRSETIEEFLDALEKPRRVIIMVKAGDPTDAVINELADAMEDGDIIIDGGNALYTDTIRREKAIRERGLHFVGAGISGGEEGALNGPSIMPGGPAESYKSLGPLLEEISAHVDGVPCCTHVGPDGAGHFVKMVHNGIEYSDMQLIGEAYQLLRDGLGKTAPEIADVFAEWNKGDLDSFLIEITAEVLRQTDAKTGKPLVDVILDEAEQKGTGRWTVKSALDLGVPVTGIAEAVFARALSGSVAQRKATTGLASGDLGEKPTDAAQFIDDVSKALYASKIIAYAQGFNQIQAGSAEYNWGIKPGDMATIWRGGCIIRAKFLNRIKEAFDEDADLPSLIVASVLPHRHRGSHRQLATRRGEGHRTRHPDPRLLLGAVVLRRATHRATARRAHPGSARLLRSAHLRPHRRRSRQTLPHPLERRPQRSPRLAPITGLRGIIRGDEVSGGAPSRVRPDLQRRLHRAEPLGCGVTLRRRLVQQRRLGHHHPGGGGQHDRGRGPANGRDGGPPRRDCRSAARPSDRRGAADGGFRQKPRPGRRHPGDLGARRFGVRRAGADLQARTRGRGGGIRGTADRTGHRIVLRRSRPFRASSRHRDHRLRQSPGGNESARNIRTSRARPGRCRGADRRRRHAWPVC